MRKLVLSDINQVTGGGMCACPPGILDFIPSLITLPDVTFVSGVSACCRHCYPNLRDQRGASTPVTYESQLWACPHFDSDSPL